MSGAASYIGTGITFIGSKVSTATGIGAEKSGGMGSGSMSGFGSEDMQRSGSDYYNPPGGYSSFSNSEIIRSGENKWGSSQANLQGQ